MPSSSRPYQSKVLRFVLQQWQQGVERQNRAWRQLQNTTTWGIQVVAFPFYAMVRAMERASFALGSDGGTDQTIGHSSGSTRARHHVTDSEHSLTAILSHTQQLLSLEQQEQLNLIPKENLVRRSQSLVANLVAKIRRQPDSRRSPRQNVAIEKARQPQPSSLSTAHGGSIAGSTAGIPRRGTSTLLQPRTTLASSLSNRKLVLVNHRNEVFDIFTPAQQSDLQHYIARIMQAYEQSRPQSQAIANQRPQQLPLRTILKIAGNTANGELLITAVLAHTQQLLSSTQRGQLAIASTGRLTVKRFNGIHTRSASTLVQNRTTLASSLKTQKLVLVNSKNEVFDIFTPAQQIDLQRYIARVMQVYTQSKTIVRRRTKKLSLNTVLIIGGVFINALPGELKRAWSQISAGPQALKLPHIKTSGLPAEPSTRIFYPHSSASTTLRVRVRPSPNPDRRRLTSQSPDAFEADVNGVSYVEHPLEKILRWIDHILLWCERRWYRWRRSNLR